MNNVFWAENEYANSSMISPHEASRVGDGGVWGMYDCFVLWHLSEPIHQSISKQLTSTNQPVSHSITSSINWSASQPDSQPVNLPGNQLTKQQVGQLTQQQNTNQQFKNRVAPLKSDALVLKQSNSHTSAK